MKQEKAKETNIFSFYKFFGLVADIITYPIVIVALLSVMSMILTNQKGEVPSAFGYSIVTVISPSMTKAGYKVGDLALIKSVNTDNLRPGDIIAFYYKSDVGASHPSLTLIEDFDNPPPITSDKKVVGPDTKEDAIKSKVRVYFHRIEQIYVVADGTRFFKTKGDNNPTADVHLIKEDFVIGKNIEFSPVIKNFVSFASSSKGMISLVVLPLSILVLFECFSIIEQVNNWLIEEKVFYREEPFNSPESLKANLGRDMDIGRKCYFYATSSPEERKEVAEFLWYYKPISKMSKEEADQQKRADIALKLFDKKPEKFWSYWIETSKSKGERKRISKFMQQYEYEKIIKQSAELKKKYEQEKQLEKEIKPEKKKWFLRRKMEDKKLKQKVVIKRITKVVNTIVDCIVYPIIIFSIISSFLMLSSKNKTQPKSFLGYSVATVLTGSMVAGGFDVNQIVFLKEVEAKNLRPGDVISFFRYVDNGDPKIDDLYLIEDFNNIPNPSSQKRVVGTKTKQDAINAKALIIFHRISKVYMAEDGTRFFETKGDSNQFADATLVREDFVIGRNINLPKWVTSVLTYSASAKGIFAVVILPLSILIIIQLFEVMSLIFALITERKVLTREIRFDSEESIEANVGMDMLEHDKIYFYDISATADKPAVKEFLWGHLNKDFSTEKEKLHYDKVEYSLGLYNNVSRDSYWNFWISEQKSNRKITKLKNLKILADLIVKGENISSLSELKAELENKESKNIEADFELGSTPKEESEEKEQTKILNKNNDKEE